MDIFTNDDFDDCVAWCEDECECSSGDECDSKDIRECESDCKEDVVSTEHRMEAIFDPLHPSMLSKLPFYH